MSRKSLLEYIDRIGTAARTLPPDNARSARRCVGALTPRRGLRPGPREAARDGAATVTAANRQRALRVERMAPNDEEVARAWRRLQAEGAISTPFLTYEWCSALADVPEACDGLHVLVARRDGEPVGLFPLEWTTAYGRFHAVGPAGWLWLAPDHLDVIAAPADRLQVAHAFGRYLTGCTDWEVVDFQGLAQDGALAAALPEALRLPRFAVTCAEQPSPVVTLEAKSEQELLPSRNLRQQVRRGLRAAERQGGGLSVVSDPALLPGLLETMMRLHNARFGEVSEVFATPARRRFHLLAAHRLATAGMARIYRLTSADLDVGLLYAFALDRRLYYYSMGIAPEQTLSPGRTVLGQAVLQAAAEGFTEFDLLRGDHEYKWRFADRDRPDVVVRALRLSPRTVTRAVPPLARRAAQRLRTRWKTQGP